MHLPQFVDHQSKKGDKVMCLSQIFSPKHWPKIFQSLSTVVLSRSRNREELRLVVAALDAGYLWSE